MLSCWFPLTLKYLIIPKCVFFCFLFFDFCFVLFLFERGQTPFRISHFTNVSTAASKPNSKSSQLFLDLQRSQRNYKYNLRSYQDVWRPWNHPLHKPFPVSPTGKIERGRWAVYGHMKLRAGFPITDEEFAVPSTSRVEEFCHNDMFVSWLPKDPESESETRYTSLWGPRDLFPLLKPPSVCVTKPNFMFKYHGEKAEIVPF